MEEDEDPSWIFQSQPRVQIPSLTVLSLMKLVTWTAAANYEQLLSQDPSKDEAKTRNSSNSGCGSDVKEDGEELWEPETDVDFKQQLIHVQCFLEDLFLPVQVIEAAITYLARQDQLTHEAFLLLLRSPSARNVKRLYVTGARSSRIPLHLLGSLCPFVEELDFSNVNVPGRVLREAFKHLKSIKAINLKWCDRLDNAAVDLLLRNNCATLQDLNMGWCKQVTETGLDCLPQCLELRQLNASGTSIGIHILRRVTLNCSKLECLGLKNCKHLETLSGCRFSHLPLRELNLTGLSFVSPFELSLLIEACPTLTKLVLAETTVSNRLIGLLTRTKVTALDLSWCEPSTGDHPSLTPIYSLNLRSLQLQCYPLEDEDVRDLGTDEK
eukprot:gb/GECG01003649.1/.p1 GENE.gb/GECG01003649.1/~~gb/GECG01003649.1/.p1  ORF type:complete len:383 (+),score=38.64 gb/GECG01003649.1/:1-1149(+)